MNKKILKKIKFFQKSIDKIKVLCYNIDVERERSSLPQGQKQ